MKIDVVNKSTIVNRFVLHTLQRNITHLALITRNTNIKLGILKGGGGRTGKEPKKLFIIIIYNFKYDHAFFFNHFSLLVIITNLLLMK